MTKPQLQVNLTKIIDEFRLEKIYAPENIDDIMVKSCDVHRPGIQLSEGYYDYFDCERIQILGKVEHSYMLEKSSDEQKKAYEMLMSNKIPAVVVTRGLDVSDELLEAAKKYSVPLLRTEESTSSFMAALIASLNLALAPSITRHGVLVEVDGEEMLEGIDDSELFDKVYNIFKENNKDEFEFLD